MSEWRDISTAPKDGTWFQAKIPGHGSDNVIAWMEGFMDADANPCGAWTFMTEQEPPDDWADGVCWGVNENGVACTQPTHWKHLPTLGGK